MQCGGTEDYQGKELDLPLSAFEFRCWASVILSRKMCSFRFLQQRYIVQEKDMQAQLRCWLNRKTNQQPNRDDILIYNFYKQTSAKKSHVCRSFWNALLPKTHLRNIRNARLILPLEPHLRGASMADDCPAWWAARCAASWSN